jgi:DNA processing protein
MERSYLIGLAMCKGVEPSTLRKLVRSFGSARNVWEAGVDEWKQFVRMQQKTASYLDAWRRHVRPDRLEKNLYEKGIHVITRMDAFYPPQLHELDEPPLALFLQGALSPNCLLEPGIAVVGTRRASGYGLEAARWIGETLARSGITVVSGMALGIDAAAHTASLESGGKTVALLGCGVDVCYPQTNFKVYKRIQESGLFVSEYSPGSNVSKHHFPERNRLIAALAKAVVVVQAGEKSGALLTVDHALELGRDVYVVPGPITSIHFRGSHKLLSQGAEILLDPSELLRDYGLPRHIPESDSIPARWRELYEAIGESSHPAVLANILQIPVSHVFAGLMELELSGALVRGQDGTYHRRFS